MAQKSKPVTERPVAVEAQHISAEKPASATAEFPVNDFKGAMIFDLDPSLPTSIVNGNRVVLVRNGIKSVMATARE